MTYAAVNEAAAENWQRFLLVLLSLTLVLRAAKCLATRERDGRKCVEEAAVRTCTCSRGRYYPF